jgi:hypothetical protein
MFERITKSDILIKNMFKKKFVVIEKKDRGE